LNRPKIDVADYVVLIHDLLAALIKDCHSVLLEAVVTSDSQTD
jgi:hypothetical protein